MHFIKCVKASILDVKNVLYPLEYSMADADAPE